jgi:hypothetical protein
MWWWSILLLSGCAVFLKDHVPASAKKTHYFITFEQKGWHEIKDQRSDYIWQNQKDGRILLSNSFCQEFQDQELSALAAKTFHTVSEFEIDSQSYTSFANREAYQLEGKGRVDGVAVSLKLLNTRRHNCYFDFVSINPISSGNNGHLEFESFLKAVVFK